MSAIELKSNAIILRAIQINASDIHIIPGKNYSHVQMRVDHRLLDVERIKTTEAEKLISHYKFRSKMDIGEKRRPQNGSLCMSINQQQTNLRISTLPTFPHESLAIRILPQNKIEIPLENLALFKSQTNKIRALLKKAHGLLLFSGPTGSGKTTTIYSLLNDSLIKNKRIISIEDPIEKRIDGLIQVEINEKAGLNYQEVLKATLRHDPDIIVISEIRDTQTAKMAVRAAMTGHLVISTIHANNCIGCISRLREFGIAEYDIKETVIGLVSQRLLELKCPICVGNCSLLCQINRKKRRLAVYEILAGKLLEEIFCDSSKRFAYESLEKVINKGIALGYVYETEFDRWLTR
ncbi:hypothetical protein BKP37_08155 [Anaerobacillus alkalilacustris]|uniref:Bacterial type II secretion system protein E domain-containing protein n=1 Tax=Anaerobacillus alkalilacustris TaxID=393763 RepID=A0A1S2LQV2_9BACI|nr:competence type IV pilus ATPase ComGA [Anaerobacillus alkalilacustris]OIJ14493.1 hypothetical protein BKP37_08155 [Anaerobacillus alkalilacustris]